MKKRGIAPIVATVLIILITVVAATLIAAFILPFVNDKLSEGKTCFDTLGDLEIYYSDYNCYYVDSNEEGRVGFSVKVNGEKISGFKVVLVDSGNADSITIKSGTTDASLRMLAGDFNQPLEFPDLGGVRTYVYKGNAKSVEIYPITTTDDECNLSDSIQLDQCINQGVIDDLFIF